MNDNRVFVVTETKFIERDGTKVEVAVVQDASGKTEELDIVREDTADNAIELTGSQLPDGDTTTPGVVGESDGEEAAGE